MDELLAPVLMGPVEPVQRLRVVIRGAVQGVGFRPFVDRLATSLGLTGWVRNSAQGVVIEVDGSPPRLRRFLRQLETEKPPRAFVQGLEAVFLDPAGHERFVVRASEEAGEKNGAPLARHGDLP